MILPLTHEHGTVRRLPVVTLAIMGLCVLVQIRVAGAAERMEESEGRFGTAMLYFIERPYLEADPRLVPPELTDLLAEWGVQELAAGEPSALQQKTLDAHTEDWIESLRRHPLWTGGLLPADVEAPKLVTHAFLHGGWLHLVGNLLFLYLMGPFVEDHWGRWAYGAFYLVAAAVAGLGFALHYPNLFRPLVGASGAVAAVMGAFLVLHGRAKVQFLVYVGFAAGTFAAPAWVMLPLWFAGQVTSAMAADAALPAGLAGGVAYWAHIWGFGFGLVAAVALRVSGAEERLRPFDSDDTPRLPAQVADPVLGEIGGLLARELPMEALRVLDRASRNPRASIPVLQAHWDLSRELGRAEEGVDAAHRLVREEVRSGDLESALLHWRELQHALPERRGAARVGVPLAETLAKAERPLDAESVLREVAPGLDSRTPLGTVMKAARLAADLDDRDLRLRTLDAALDHPQLPADLREELDLQRVR